MNYPQLLDYIRQQVASGISREQIISSLVSQGWTNQDISEALASLEGPPVISQSGNPAVPQQPASAAPHLTGFFTLLKTAAQIYKQRWLTLVLLSLTATVVTFGLAFVFALVVGLGVVSLISTPTILPLLLGGILVGGLVIGYVGAVLGGAQLYAVTNPVSGYFSSLGWAFKHSFSLWWVYFLLFFLLIGGFSLLVIPGILFAVWFLLGPFVYVEEGDRGFKAMFKSKHYVRGNFLPMFLRLLPIGVLFFIISYIPIPYVSQVLMVLLTPFFAAYGYSLYVSARAVRERAPVTPKRESRVAYIAACLIGLLAPTILLTILQSERKNAEATLDELNRSHMELEAELQNLRDAGYEIPAYDFSAPTEFEN